MEIKKNLAKYFPFFGFAFIFVGLIFRNIQYSKIPFLEWDEGIYAEIGREVLKGHFLPTTFNNVLWLEKPPLIPGLLAIDFKIFGYSEFWGRMLMVIFAMSLVILCFYLTKKMLEELPLKKNFKISRFELDLVSFLPGLAIISAPMIIERSTDVSTDLLLAVGWIGFFLTRNNLVGKLFFTVLGVGAKSLFGFYPLILDSLFLLIQKKFRQLFANIIIGLISSVWFIWGYFKYGNQFIELHFYDQLIKRATAPIELHFGGFLYYPQVLLNNLFLTLPFLILSYFFLIKLIARKNFVDVIKQKKIALFTLFSFIPFIIFLIFTKSKLQWYIVPALPFIFMPLGLFYLDIKNSFLRKILLGVVYLLLLINFSALTYFLNLHNENIPKLQLAKCLSKETGDNVAFLVDVQERQNKNVLEATNLQTTNSFIYGGSPAFVFYVKKHVDFSYDPVLFKESYLNNSLIVLTQNDIQNYKFNLAKYRRVCGTVDYFGYEKK